MKKLGGVDEDEKGDTIFNNEEHAVEEQRQKRTIWIGYMFGVMMGGIVDHLRPKRNYSIAMKIISLFSWDFLSSLEFL